MRYKLIKKDGVYPVYVVKDKEPESKYYRNWNINKKQEVINEQTKNRR